MLSVNLLNYNCQHVAVRLSHVHGLLLVSPESVRTAAVSCQAATDCL